MWLMLQQTRPGDYVVATGQLHKVREVVQVAFDHVQLDWRASSNTIPTCAPRRTVPSRGQPRRARRDLSWQPATSFEALIREMTEAELRALD